MYLLFSLTHCEMTAASELHKLVTWNENQTFFLTGHIPAAKEELTHTFISSYLIIKILNIIFV